MYAGEIRVTSDHVYVRGIDEIWRPVDLENEYLTDEHMAALITAGVA